MENTGPLLVELIKGWTKGVSDVIVGLREEMIETKVPRMYGCFPHLPTVTRIDESSRRLGQNGGRICGSASAAWLTSSFPIPLLPD